MTDSATHLSPELVAAYLDRALSASDQDAVEAHLADCAECREELAAVAPLTARSGARRWLPVAVPVAAAAALVIAFLPSQPDGGVSVPALRSGDEGVRQVDVVGPTAGRRVPADSVVFVWRPLAGDARYHLTVTTTNGEAAWTARTADTLLAPERRGARLEPGPYFWYVDALLPDGTSGTTGVQRFEVIR